MLRLETKSSIIGIQVQYIRVVPFSSKWYLGTNVEFGPGMSQMVSTFFYPHQARVSNSSLNQSTFVPECAFWFDHFNQNGPTLMSSVFVKYTFLCIFVHCEYSMYCRMSSFVTSLYYFFFPISEKRSQAFLALHSGPKWQNIRLKVSHAMLTKIKK